MTEKFVRDEVLERDDREISVKKKICDEEEWIER